MSLARQAFAGAPYRVYDRRIGFLRGRSEDLVAALIPASDRGPLIEAELELTGVLGYPSAIETADQLQHPRQCRGGHRLPSLPLSDEAALNLDSGDVV